MESNHPGEGLPRLGGFEDRAGHQTRCRSTDTVGADGGHGTERQRDASPSATHAAASCAADLLAEARGQLVRLSATKAREAMARGAILIDIRSESQRARDGQPPSSQFVARNVLEWRLDPASEFRDPTLSRPDTLLILMCDEGYQSSLAAATLRRFGLQSTDMVGGYQAWVAAGLPTEQVLSPP